MWLSATTTRPKWVPFALPVGAPPRAPCMRHTAQPLTAGDWHGLPVLFEHALQRKARCMASFEEEGSVVAVIGDLYGSLAAAHHGTRDDGLVGVHGDVLYGDFPPRSFCMKDQDSPSSRRYPLTDAPIRIAPTTARASGESGSGIARG